MSEESSNCCSSGLKCGIIGFVIGAAAGAVAALLLTTKTGEELRTDIKRAVLEITAKVEEKADKIKNMTKEKYSEIINGVTETYNKAKDFTEKEIDIIKKVILEQKDLES
jgi:gas vesicle protein